MELERLEWINEVNNILSKIDIGIVKRGDNIINELDVVLNYFSSNVSIIDVIPEAKKILFHYLKVLERIATLIKHYNNELLNMQNAKLIKIGDKFYILLPDHTIISEEDREKFLMAYRNAIESFKRTARYYIYTLLCGLQKREEQERLEKPMVYVPPRQEVMREEAYGGEESYERPHAYTV